jgi:hypothetical protein
MHRLPPRRAQATLDSGRRLEGEVLAPIARWQDVYHSLVVRMRGLEKQRLEVDSRRRTVAGLSSRVDAQRAKLGGSSSGTKAENKLESTIKLLQHKEDPTKALQCTPRQVSLHAFQLHFGAERCAAGQGASREGAPA